MSKKASYDKILSQIYADWLEGDNPDNFFKKIFGNVTPEKIINFEQNLSNINEIYNHNCSTVHSYKDDTNIIIIVLDNCVVKIYKKNQYDNIKSVILLEDNNIEKCLYIQEYDNIVFVVTEKINIFLNSYGELNPLPDKVTKEDLYNQISLALSKIHEIGYIHNDVSLDNIGYKFVNGKYIFIIFDFGASRQYTNYDNIGMESDKLIASIDRYLT